VFKIIPLPNENKEIAKFLENIFSRCMAIGLFNRGLQVDYSLKMYETDSTNVMFIQNSRNTVNNFSSVPWGEPFGRGGENNIRVFIYPFMQYVIKEEKTIPAEKSPNFFAKLFQSNKQKVPIQSQQKATVAASSIEINNEALWCLILNFIVGNDCMGRPVNHTLAFVANKPTINELLSLIQQNNDVLINSIPTLMKKIAGMSRAAKEKETAFECLVGEAFDPKSKKLDFCKVPTFDAIEKNGRINVTIKFS